MPEYVVLDKDTIKSEIMSYLSIAKKKTPQHSNTLSDGRINSLSLRRNNIKEENERRIRETPLSS